MTAVLRRESDIVLGRPDGWLLASEIGPKLLLTSRACSGYEARAASSISEAHRNVGSRRGTLDATLRLLYCRNQ
jgi:hypothetical protein